MNRYKTSMKTKKTIIFTLLIGLFIFSPRVYADEISVTGNGDSSTNTASSQNQSTTTVQQSNTTEISNVVTSTTQTGNNEASSNTGDAVTIETGDSNVVTSVSNDANASTVTKGACCVDQSNNTTISGNGVGSSNSAHTDTSSSDTIQVSNTASITNNIYGFASTGNNQANKNTGQVSIRTGSIRVDEYIFNGPINSSRVSLLSGKNTSRISIINNGTDSTNTVTVLDPKTQNILITNSASLTNISLWDLITGENSANGNTGLVTIVTGDIQMNVDIVNGPLNVSEVKTDCGCDQPEQPAPTPSTGGVTPTSSTGGGGGSNGSTGGASGVVGSSVGSLLPATGMNWLFYALISNMLMFIFGMCLRLRSGRSPGMVAAAF